LKEGGAAGRETGSELAVRGRKNSSTQSSVFPVKKPKVCYCASRKTDDLRVFFPEIRRNLKTRGVCAETDLPTGRFRADGLRALRVFAASHSLGFKIILERGVWAVVPI